MRTLQANDNSARDESGDKSDRGNVQGEALQTNDNSAEGKKPCEVTSSARGAVTSPTRAVIKARVCRSNEKQRGRVGALRH